MDMTRTLLFLLVIVVALVNVTTTEADAGRGSFSVECAFSHTLNDDPIVYPNLPAASHSHDFFGNVSTRASSTEETMAGSPTSCGDLSDRAGYWNPTAYVNGVRVPAIRVSAYYFGTSSGDVSAFPPGLQMIAGNKDAASAADNPRVQWSCTKGNESPLQSHPYDCAPYGGRVTARIDFPTCWDGLDLGPGHVAYATGEGCPGGSMALPQLSYRVRWDVRDPCAGATPCGAEDAPSTNIAFTVSTGSDDAVRTDGAFYTLHADFWNAWRQDSLDSLVTTCLNAHQRCGRQVG
jgi:Domain of unknown function (DUF1996)